MLIHARICFVFGMLLLSSLLRAEDIVTLNQKDDGYRGIWYMNQPAKTIYKYKYSGGLATYCAKHKPFAVYCEKVNKTFFCYGGTTKSSNQELRHMSGMTAVSIFLTCDRSDEHD